MHHHHIAIMLQHLCSLLAQHYCGHAFHIDDLTKSFFRHCLAPAIATRWKIDEGLLFSEETFWRASHKRPIGTATLERFAILYYAATDKACAALMNEEYLRLVKLKELHHTPRWNRFKEEYPALVKSANAAVLPGQCCKWVKQLSDKDFKKLQKAMERREKEKGHKVKLAVQG